MLVVTPMPTPPSSYSPSAAEKLRLALLALAASAAATGCDRFGNPFCTRTAGAILPPPPVMTTEVPDEPETLSDKDPATEPIVMGEAPAVPVEAPIVGGEPPVEPSSGTNDPETP